MKKTIIPVLVVMTVVALAALAAPHADRTEASDLPQLSATSPAPFQLVEVASGFTHALYMTSAGDGTGRIFVVQQTGVIQVLNSDYSAAGTFLDVSERISREALTDNYTERGLLGLAFPPDYAESGVFYINYTDVNGNTVLARYSVTDDPNVADPASEQIILQQEQPYSNHNGGHLAFGPDGYLYMALGDGGSGGDPEGNAQNLGTLLGSIIRIDVTNPPDGQGYGIPDDNPFVGDSSQRGEIWAWGLRNPWRFSFDRATGDLYIADVGQDVYEEVNFQPADSTGGENYGWNAYEASHAYSGGDPASDVVMPIAEYAHSDGSCSVTGGYVYRGTTVPELDGTYFYGDWCNGVLYWIQRDAAGEWQYGQSMASGPQIASFGEDEAGNLYIVGYSGRLYRFDPVS
ncbi:PQQ-dependent sugar dehydrogenase [Aggregatilinea lenta]|uniref:PQQ-dependent sugar dehydrogenase n=1 Tax=Aggregatilinea lenta TaxID=913108 RepID=UPI000E5C1B3B|nr:PQQ-dependent sugar dehydrogenase [Aggregatilinea lenta]